MEVGYLVVYSSGSYEDYHERFVAVYMNKEDAEKKCEEIREYHKNPPKPEWDQDDWYDIDEAFYQELDRPTTIGERYPAAFDSRLRKDFDSDDECMAVHNQKVEAMDRMLEDIVMKFFPSWTREKAREQIDLQLLSDHLANEEFNDAWIKEINVFS